MKYFMFILSVCYSVNVLAQNDAGDVLKTGDTLPPLQLQQVNGSEPVLALNWKHKITILGFWNTRCSGTYAFFKQVGGIQKQLGNQVQIVLVSEDDAPTTQAFMNKNRSMMPEVPIVIADSFLARKVPFIQSPHIWVGENGAVNYITISANMNSNTIQKIAEGYQLPLTQLNLGQHIMTDQPVFVFDSSLYLSSLSYYSYIGHCIGGLDIGFRVINTKGKQEHPNRITQNCSSPIDLLRVAFSEFEKYDLRPAGTIIFEGVDRPEFEAPSPFSGGFDAWSQAHLFNYDLMVPEERWQELYLTMQQDLCRFFHVQARIEKRKINCYVLSGEKMKLKKTGDSMAVPKRYVTDSFYNYRNTSLEDFIRSVSHFFERDKIAAPLVNDTRYSGKISIKISKKVFDPVDISAFNKELAAYGLRITEAPRMADVLVVGAMEEKKAVSKGSASFNRIR